MTNHNNGQPSSAKKTSQQAISAEEKSDKCQTYNKDAFVYNRKQLFIPLNDRSKGIIVPNKRRSDRLTTNEFLKFTLLSDEIA